MYIFLFWARIQDFEGLGEKKDYKPKQKKGERGKRERKRGKRKEKGKKKEKEEFLAHTGNKRNLFAEKNHIFSPGGKNIIFFPQGKRILYISLNSMSEKYA